MLQERSERHLARQWTTVSEGSEEGTCETGYGKDDCQKTTCQEAREKSPDKEGRQKDACKKGG
jgi:hypothetical protein